MRILIVCLAVLGLASAAGAATLTVTPDKFTYNIGETITLTINGDAQGATSNGVFGRLEMNGALVDVVSTTQKVMATGWTKGVLTITDDGVLATVEVLNQLTNPAAGQTATNPIATVTLIARSFGFLNVNWSAVAGSGSELDFFGLTSAPGIGICVGCGEVPEPSTHLLVALGLLALARYRRRA